MYWDTAQEMAEAIADFDKIDEQEIRSLQRTDIICASLLAADVLATVFRHPLVASPTQIPTDGTTQATQTVPSSNQWYEIDAVLKRRKRREGDFFFSSSGNDPRKQVRYHGKTSWMLQYSSTSATTRDDIENESENLHCTVPAIEFCIRKFFNKLRAYTNDHGLVQ